MNPTRTTIVGRRELARRITKSALATGTAGLTLSTLIAVAPEANAAAGDYTYTYGANVRSCGNAGPPGSGPGDCHVGSVVGYLPAGWYRTYAWRDGGWANGTNRWFLVRGNTRCGWISASTTDNARQARVPWASSWNVGSNGCPR